VIPVPWPHQKQSLNVYERTPIILDTSDPGTGKTRAAIDAFAKRRFAGGGKALVIAPKPLLDPAWAADVRQFQPKLLFSVAYAKNRAAAFKVEADLYITNTDAVTTLAKKPRKFFDGFDTLIIDEISYFKHRTSARSKALKKLSNYFHYRVGMTGTPTSNSITDIWHQVLILDHGERLGTSFFAFRDVVCKQIIINPMKPEWSKWEDKPESRETVAQILSDISVRHEFDVVMKNIPEQTKHLLYYQPSKRLLEFYEKLKEYCLLQLQEGEVTALNAASLRQKLLQVASGRVYGKDKVFNLDSGRTDLIVELILGRTHSVVFWNWQHQREGLTEALTKKKVKFAEIGKDTKNKDRADLVSRYQAGEYQTLLMHPQSGAHGLTLTKGTSVIWCSPTDRADLLVQGDARIRRGGQSLATESIRVCAKGTLEEKVYERIGEKLDAMSHLMELLK